MRFISFLFCCATLCAFPAQAGDKNPCEGEIVFPDSALEQAVREDISKPNGGIYYEDVKDLKYLSGENQGIVDLTNIHCLDNLETADLVYNQISDTSPLSTMTHLSALILTGNAISDVSPLSALVDLEDLDLSNNQVSDLSPLIAMSGLRDLRIEDSQLEDISPLGDLITLETIFLSNNQIKDISSLSKLSNLSYLRLEKNQIEDISPLSNLTELTSINLRVNRVSDIKPLVDNVGLGEGTSIDLQVNPLDCNSSETLNYLKQLEERGVSIVQDCYEEEEDDCGNDCGSMNYETSSCHYTNISADRRGRLINVVIFILSNLF
ncbi:MAG: leucine-rich repeat domain-containing protein [Myxococcota bacterium]|nr:leucine-rich repeat domain-containing protein [Myxococcota bacterium]